MICSVNYVFEILGYAFCFNFLVLSSVQSSHRSPCRYGGRGGMRGQGGEQD